MFRFWYFFTNLSPGRQEFGPSTPRLYIAGTWGAIVSSLLFTAIYTFRVAEEARRLAEALSATELVLQREQHLSALDGLAAAAAHELGTPLATIALVSKEMQRELGEAHALSDDAKLLRSQAQRCREILQKLTSLSEDGDAHLDKLPLTSLIEEIVAPHRDFGVSIEITISNSNDVQPVSHRNPGVLYGLSNLVENAVDFAHSKVQVHTDWTKDTVSIMISDDGPGFPSEVIGRIGAPFVTSRHQSIEPVAGGLGLGLFIAKTLLERSGAILSFSNNTTKGGGAQIDIQWQRETFDQYSQMPGEGELHNKLSHI